MIISSSDGSLYPRQKCSIHIKMVQKDMFPTAMPFFQHSFFVYLISFMQIKGHSKGARITHSRYSISRVRIPSATPVHEPDKILATHIAGFPFDDPRKLMSPWIVNVAALDGQRLLSRIEKEAVELWIPHDFQCGSVKRNPAAAKIERNSRLFYIPVCILLIAHSITFPKGRTCPLDNHTASQQHLITCIRHDKGTLLLPFSQPASRSCQHPHGNIAVHMVEGGFLPMLLYRYAKCICNIVRIISFAGIYFRLLLHLSGYWF